jgi:DNA-binding NtrC family response regulator
MKMGSRLLLVEDDDVAATSLRRVLCEEGYAVTVASRGDVGLSLAAEGNFDVVLTDLRMPGLDGFELVTRLSRSYPQLPVLLMTAHGTAEVAIEATRRGAFDYLLKPFGMQELLEVLEKAVRSRRLMADPVVLGSEPASTKEAIIGSSRSMQVIFKEIGRIAARPVPVLIRGETGTGKELIARAIFQYSDRANRPFIAVNCAAIPETLLESELFGHERGAFTGAEVRRIGRFEQADGGTLFLDEIGDMIPGTQAKLLRVLQEKTIQRLGGRELIPVNVRILAATHRDLEAAVAAKEFREDLLYRINLITLTLPSLQQRSEDIPALVNYFLRRHGADLGVEKPAIHPEALDLLQRHAWPGNVRELENTVRKALLLSRGYPIDAELIKEAITDHTSVTNRADLPFAQHVAALLEEAKLGKVDEVYYRVMADVERELVSQAITLAEGNLTRAAHWLGITRLTLRDKLAAFGIR